ncbi:PH domain-containing protein [Tsukamurella soli]|uniref:PH domain-containing protein n=1 Tax=Tsukamurella soli TaxID=644556 RepID=A0ABP8K000_9ACTN
MGFPESSLVDGEELLLHTHPHVKRLVVPVLALLFASAAAGVLGGIVWRSVESDNARVVAEAAVLVVWVIVVVWATLRPWIAWGSTHFAVTDRRVVFRRGVVRRAGIDIPLRRINSVEYRQGLLDRVLRCGVLRIESASEDPLEFDDIPRISAVHGLLYREGMSGGRDRDDDAYDRVEYDPGFGEGGYDPGFGEGGYGEGARGRRRRRR